MNIAVSKIPHITGDVYFATPNQPCEIRVNSLFTKEPDTIAWIEGFNPGDIFVDIGANVGMYSIWAARTTGAKVYAFEPESQNFAVLCQNIALNHVDIMPYPIALSDEQRVSSLYLAALAPGASCHTLGEATSFKGEPMRAAFVQGAYADVFDRLVAEQIVPQPDYIKIDVDGLEPRVVRGARKSIAASRSVLIEIDTNRDAHRSVIGQMEDMGFRWSAEEAEKARRKEGAFAGIGNVIFRR